MTQKDEQIKKEDKQTTAPAEQSFYFPNINGQSVTVKATNQAEALEKAKAKIKVVGKDKK